MRKTKVDTIFRHLRRYNILLHTYITTFVWTVFFAAPFVFLVCSRNSVFTVNEYSKPNYANVWFPTRGACARARPEAGLGVCALWGSGVSSRKILKNSDAKSAFWWLRLLVGSLRRVYPSKQHCLSIYGRWLNID